MLYASAIPVLHNAHGLPFTADIMGDAPTTHEPRSPQSLPLCASSQFVQPAQHHLSPHLYRALDATKLTPQTTVRPPLLTP